MRQLRIVILKEFYHILRDSRTLLILFGLPLVQILLFGFAITNEIKGAKMAVVDASGDDISREMVQRLTASDYFIYQGRAGSREEVLHLFREGKIKMALFIPPNLQRDFYHGEATEIQLLADATDPNTATTLVNYATAIINDYQLGKLDAQDAPFQIKTELTMRYNPLLKSVYLFVPGVMTVILMLVSAMMTSIALTREKELGTMEVLLVSPLQPPFIIIGKVIPYFILGMVNATLIVTLGVLVFGMPVQGSWLLLGAETILFILTSLALGILISTRTDSQQVAMMMSLMALMLPTIILSGFIFPIESMPRPLQLLSNIIPAKWFIIILRNIMLKGVGFDFVWRETLILFGMFSFFTLLSIRNFKIRLA